MDGCRAALSACPRWLKGKSTGRRRKPEIGISRRVVYSR